MNENQNVDIDREQDNGQITYANEVISTIVSVATTEVDGIAYIERGYENIVEKLQGLGADITRVTVPEEDRMPMAR